MVRGILAAAPQIRHPAYCHASLDMGEKMTRMVRVNIAVASAIVDYFFFSTFSTESK